MKEQIRREPKILAAAERQMQAWARTQEIAARAARAAAAKQPRAAIAPFITISREAGACGGEVARLIGEKLGWEVLDKNLLDRMADRFHVPRFMLDAVDETAGNWVYDVLGSWMDRKIVPHEKYISYLGRVIRAAARRASCVFVGRGARFLLSPDKGLAVRLVASEKYRIEQIMKREGLAAAEARRWVEQTDRGRRDFVQRFFHHDLSDPHLYDLIINTEKFGTQGAAELIVAAVGRQGA
jgi:cytidylate kinase